MSRVAEVLCVARSNLNARTGGKTQTRGAYRKADDADLVPAIRRLVDARPTYGYRRITALLNRERKAVDLALVNRKRVLRIIPVDLFHRCYDRARSYPPASGARSGRGRTALNRSSPSSAARGTASPPDTTARLPTSSPPYASRQPSATGYEFRP